VFISVLLSASLRAIRSRAQHKYYPLNTRGNKGFSNYHAMIASLESSNLRNLDSVHGALYVLRDQGVCSTFSDSSNNFNLGVLDVV